MSAKTTLIIASLLGALAVVLGAFGAHSLKTVLDTKALVTYELGITYQYYHVFALVATGLWAKALGQTKLLSIASWCFCLGIIFFSGSLYLLATRTLLGTAAYSGIYGPLTPIGGVFFVIGWMVLCLQAIRIK